MSQNDEISDAELSALRERLSALGTENAVLRNALDIADLGVWSWDLEDVITCDARAGRLIGVPAGQAVAVADFLVRFKEAEHSRLLDAFDCAQRRTGEFDEVFELDVRGAKAGVGRLRIQGQLSTDARVLSGTCCPGAAVLPVSAAGGSLARMAPFLPLSADIYIEQNYDGYIQWVSPNCATVLGYAPSELKGHLYWDFLHSEDLAHTRQLVERAVAAGGVLSGRFENRFCCKNGDTVWLSWRYTVNAKAQRVYALARDVSDVKAQQERLTRALAQMQDANVELQSFASVASHDLREPLRMISSYLRLLQERSPDALDARAQRYINYACGGGGSDAWADRRFTVIFALGAF